MIAARNLAAVVLPAVCALALAGCGDLERYRGTKGLPPAPTNLAYPAVGITPPPRPGVLKTPAEQKKLEADLLARKRR